MLPESSSSWFWVMPVEVSPSRSAWMPSSPVPLMLTVPLSMRKYSLQEMPSPTAEVTLIVAFLTLTYSPALMPCFTLPTMLSVPFCLNSA